MCFYKNKPLMASEFTFNDCTLMCKPTRYIQHTVEWWRWGTHSGEQCYQRVPGVVEEAAVPQAVHPSGRRVEETRVGAVKAVQAILGVLGGVAVNDIQQHHDAHWMSHIHQLLQLVWGTVPTTDTHTHIHRCVLISHNVAAPLTLSYSSSQP